MQQRYYDPAIGRFLSVDPVTANSSTGANFNRYWYANNNPYRFTDPDGRIPRGRDTNVCGITGCDAGSFVAGDGGGEGRSESGDALPVYLAPLSNPNNRFALNGDPQDAGDILTEVEKEEIKNVADKAFEILDAKGSVLGPLAKIFTAKQLSDISVSMFNHTVEWGVADIERYRLIGLHVTNPQGSLIPWQRIKVDWSVYDPGPPMPANQVFWRFVWRANSDGYIVTED